MDKATKRLLKQNPELEFLKDKGIVKCKLNDHEIPCRADIIESFVKGKKFKKLKDSQQTENLPDHLSASVINKGKVFCALTNCYINCSASNIERHTTGRRYQRALQQFRQGSLKLYEEQVKDEDGMKDPQATSAEFNSDENDVVDNQDDTIDGDDDEIDNQNDVIDDQDKFVDQRKELEELIQTTASVSKQKRKRKSLTISKDKSKRARI